MALLTEDRRMTGIFPMLSVKDNTVIANMKDYVMPIGLINHKKINEDCETYRKSIRVKTPSIQQKL